MKRFSFEFWSAVLRNKPVVGRILESVSKQRKAAVDATVPTQDRASAAGNVF